MTKLHTPRVIRTSHVRHGRASIGDCVDDFGCCSCSATLCCFVNIPEEKEQQWGQQSVSVFESEDGEFVIWPISGKIGTDLLSS